MDSIIKYWLKTTTYDQAVGIYATLPFIMAPACFLMDAPYGRFAGKLGIDCSLDGKWGWFTMEVVSPVVFAASLVITQPRWTPFQIILSSAWMIHYINRSIIYPYRASSMAPIHLSAYVCSIGFNLINGYTNGMWVARHSRSISDPLFWAGLSLWALGFLSNIYHDNILFKLRSKKKKEEREEGKKRYFIPHGGLFEYVSCPNYFSEAIEWTGYALATSGSSWPAIIFAASTASNLFPRAWRTHAWYKQQFENYPTTRKAVIPFLL
ncbi:3-oxo-5-alpha-steroid 4-dehydrogenase-domain-containing protein [Blakeslea trispora]|nr:3-oxo-5-alpha-steroid 4-dehydrogenase-domain-containing protein [Blakeslea trispora]